MTEHRYTLMTAPLDCVPQGEAVELCARWAAEKGAARNVVSLNAKTIVMMAKNPELKETLDRASLVLADGVSISLAARIFGIPLPGRVPGIDLMAALLERARERKIGCYFFGAREEVVNRLRVVLAARYPGLTIAGSHHGYFDRSGSNEIARSIRESGAGILFVALGQPEAEIWCHRHGPATGASVTISVGGSFDVLSGTIRRSPAWTQKMGLEWLWRFILEPRKRFRVIFIDHAVFLGMIVRDLIRGSGSRRA